MRPPTPRQRVALILAAGGALAAAGLVWSIPDSLVLLLVAGTVLAAVVES